MLLELKATIYLTIIIGFFEFKEIQEKKINNMKLNGIICHLLKKKFFFKTTIF